jgi:Mn2+/Fe2+ NRAMP family transporter
MIDYIKNNKRNLAIYGAIILFIAALYLTIGCPFRYFTGICCPGCGMTRALLACLKLDFKTAFHMHPLIFIMPIAAIIFLLKNKLPKWLVNTLAAVFIMLMVAVYFYRLFTDSDIVYINPENGLFSKILNYISGGF